MALEQITLIYKRDNEFSKLSAEERLEKRNLVIRPLVESFFEWEDKNLEFLDALLPWSPALPERCRMKIENK